MSDTRWTLEKLIDFEAAASQSPNAPLPLLEKIRALAGDALTRKRQAFLLWTNATDEPPIGKKFTASLGLLTLGFALIGCVSAAVSAWGCYSREHNGIHVLFFLAITLLLPWLIFLLGCLLMVFRRHITPLSWLGNFMLKHSKKSLQISDALQASILDHSRILAWRVSRQLQWVAICYHAGAAVSLLVLASFRHIHFYWESTTRFAVQHLLEWIVKILSSPWSSFYPGAVPDVASSRWVPGETLAPNVHAAWWPFLLLCLLFWGIVPRFLMMILSARNERILLDKLAFVAPHHRKLWRLLDGVKRDDISEAPIDGALVIDVGGIVTDPTSLRPYLLQQLRVNPLAWHSTAVLDPAQREAAAAAIRQAPAGIVLLVETAALAPRQITNILQEIGTYHSDTRIMIVAIGPTTSPDEADQWRDFIDNRNDSHLELFFHP